LTFKRRSEPESDLPVLCNGQGAQSHQQKFGSMTQALPTTKPPGPQHLHLGFSTKARGAKALQGMLHQEIKLSYRAGKPLSRSKSIYPNIPSAAKVIMESGDDLFLFPNRSALQAVQIGFRGRHLVSGSYLS
jgi:hypothetical protein